jgi:hypothetical protein
LCRLTEIEIEALLAVAGNVDPCMFLEDVRGEEGHRLFHPWVSGQNKLREMLAARPRPAMQTLIASSQDRHSPELAMRHGAHIVKDKAEAGHRRSDLFERRRELMVTWAAFVAAGTAEANTSDELANGPQHVLSAAATLYRSRKNGG